MLTLEFRSTTALACQRLLKQECTAVWMARVRRKWTLEEDAHLRRIVTTCEDESRPLLWREVAKQIPGRSNKDCRRRWWNSLADSTAKGLWSEEEDEQLMQAVNKYGTDWRTVARDVVSRTPDQCSSHWSQVLDPDINHCRYTSQEDGLLLHEVLSYGTNWAMIATSHAPRRTTLSLKNRYNTLRLRHENINRTNAQDKIPLATITQPNKRHVQQPLEVQAQMVNNTWNDNAAPSRGCGEAASERNELSGENDSSEDEQRDVGLPAFGNPDHSKSSSRSATGSLLPPTPGSWLGMLDQDGPFSALFPSDEIYSMIPILDEDKAIQPFEQPFIPSDSPVCLATGSPSLGDQTGGARTCGLNETRGKSCFQPNSPSISRNHGVNQLSGGDLAENMSPTSAGQGLSTVASETQSAPALQQADTVGLGPSASGQDSASYLISVNLSCTDTQLERVMTALARTGAYVNVQIERALQ